MFYCRKKKINIYNKINYMTEDHIGFFLFELIQNPEFNDNLLEIKCNDDKIIKFHICVARKSNILNNLLNNNSKLIQIPLNFEILSEIRNYIYINKINVNLNNYIKIFEGADYLDLENLKNEILCCAFNNFLNYQTLFKIEDMIYRLKNKSDFIENIDNFICNNIEEILNEPVINTLSKKRIIKLFKKYDNTNEIFFAKAFLNWIENKNEKNHIINEFLENRYLIPELLPISFLLSDFIPFLKLYKIKEERIWKIMEVACFQSIHIMISKNMFNKYEWIFNLKINDNVDIKRNNYWENAKINYIGLNDSKNKYERTLEVKLNIESRYHYDFVSYQFPKDLNKIDKIFSKKNKWKNKIEKGQMIEFFHNQLLKTGQVLAVNNKIVIVEYNSKYVNIPVITNSLIKIVENVDDYEILKEYSDDQIKNIIKLMKDKSDFEEIDLIPF